MKYAFNTWAYGSFPSWLPSYPLDEVVRRLARIGYDGIEIGCAAPHAWPAYLPAARRAELRRLMQGEGLPAVSLLPAPGGGPGFNAASPVAEERQGTVAHYKEVVDLAADLGAGIVLYIAGWQVFGTGRRDAWAWSTQALTEIGRHARERGIIVAIEPTAADSNLVETADDALEMMRETGLPNVKVMFDTYHALYRNEVAADYIRQMGADLAHIHFADTDRGAPGDGTVDWTGVMQAVRDAGFAGHLTMEIGFHTRKADPDHYARRALAYCKAIEASLG
ncbi:sugar phosphate isomerase/epimerase family protein [Labrys wisconsinensis]|uniref:Protein FrlC n=1 Tax=Labrys wisconsinensis TaxID=425677 RepID=A0ABU0JM66_9HYPH|nr:sugar phosphate isomerase/epimerase [Labrys wisconsinensis]MDQ0475390.1 protein FrlC [Labrys wisconsinensis]